MTERRCESCDATVGGGRPDACLGFLDDVVFACCGHGPDNESRAMGYVKVRVHSDFWRAFTTWIRKVDDFRDLPAHALFLWPWPNPLQADLVPLRSLRIPTDVPGIVVPLPASELLR